MPKVYDSGPTDQYRQLKLSVTQADRYWEGKDYSVENGVDVWIYRTEDLSDPDIGRHECVWGMTTDKLMGRSRADFGITLWPQRAQADLVVGWTRSKSEIGWVSDHPLRGTLMPGAPNILAEQGAPGQARPPQAGSHVTTEATSKSIKGQQVLSCVLGLVGVVLLLLALTGTVERGLWPVALTMILAGFAWFNFLKLRRWWEHG